MAGQAKPVQSFQNGPIRDAASTNLIPISSFPTTIAGASRTQESRQSHPYLGANSQSGG
ncbi:MAG: hypothetical protein HN705_11805 [Rhodospirillales bacterium]|nr:hypothetical protein [Rhodospirillales bacterium]